MKYIALTIGPIIKTLSSAKTTQELWASSYLFSYVMKEIIRGVKDREFIVPYVGDNVMTESTSIGLFHDRFIFKRESDNDLSMLSTHIEKTLENIANKLDIQVDYLKQYLQIHYDEYEVESNPILEISPYLDTLELQYQTTPNGDNLIKKALQKKDNFLKQMHFPSRPFPSLPEIALIDLIQDKEGLRGKILNTKEEDDIYAIDGYDFKPYHKYVAIIHADGDNMSKVIKELKDNEFTEFSQKLFGYCAESAQKIKDFGGETIFAGGDDLLFFAPIYNKKENQNIFGLVNDITDIFDNAFETYNKTLEAKDIEERATLSFGVRIVYYKYPLYEALEESRDLLFDVAKQGNKNNIAFNFSKHAGQTFGTVISKDKAGGGYEHFSSLITVMTEIENAGNFLGSLHHKIDTYQVLLFEACKYDDNTRVKNFFINFFKKEHKQYKLFFEQMVAYIYAVGKLEIVNEEKLRIIYAPLKYIKHIQGDKS